MSSKLENFVSFWAILWIATDLENTNFRFKTLPIPEKEIKITNEKSNENTIVQLGKPTLYLDGKPLFMVYQGLKGSVVLDLDKNREIIRGFSSSEIRARLKSQFKQKVFKNQKSNSKLFYIIVLLILSSILITVFFSITYYTSI